MAAVFIGRVLLAVLKVLLVLFLVIIIFVLLMAGLVLLPAARYKISAEKYDTLKAEGNARWLLGAVSVSFLYNDGDSSYKIKIFGADYKKLARFFKKKKNTGGYEAGSEKHEKKDTGQKDKKAVSEKKEKETLSKEKEIFSEKDKSSSEENREIQKDKKIAKGGKTDNSKGNEKTPDGGKAGSKKGTEEKEDTKEKLGNNRKKEERKNKKKTDAGERTDKSKDGIKGKVDSISGRISRIKEFVLAEYTKDMVCITKDNVLHLFKKIKPHKIKSDILFGTGDPCTTGQALGAAAVYMAFTGTFFNVTPDFENEVLRGRLEVSGHIRAVTFVFAVLRVIISRKWRRFYKEAKKFKEDF